MVIYLNPLQQDLFVSLLEEMRDYLVMVLDNYREGLENTYEQHLVEGVSGMESNEMNLMRQIEFFKWQHIGLVALISHDDCVYFEYFKSILNRLHASKHVCFFAQFVNISANGFEWKDITVGHVREQEVNITILFGHPLHQYQLMKQMEEVTLTAKRLWVTHEIAKIPSFTDLFISNHNTMRYERTKNKLYNVLPELSTFISGWAKTDETVLKIYKAIQYESVGLVNRIFKLILHSNELIAKKRHSSIRKSLRLSITQYYTTMLKMRIRKNGYEPFHLETTRPVYDSLPNIKKHSVVATGLDENHRKLLSSSQCYRIECPPGQMKTFGKLSEKQTKWRYHYGWTCMQCPKGTVKSSHGDGPCISCQGIFIANEYQTNCYDPYTLIKLRLFDQKPIIIFTFTAFAILLNIITTCILFINRNTPIGRIIDMKTSVLQLSVILILLCSLPVLFVGKNSSMACVVKLVAIFPLYTLVIAVIVVRSQKLLKAFNSKVLVTRREIFLTIMKQTLTIISLTFTSFGLLALTLLYELPGIQTILFKEVLKKELHCTYTFHLNLQVFLCVVIHVACVLPAYRGRNLPNIFNEGMAILYLSFITTISLGVMVGIQYFQPHQISRDLTTWVGLTSNCVFVMLFLYGQKVYFIICKPEKNTKRYFQDQTMASMTSSTNKRLAKRNTLNM